MSDDLLERMITLYQRTRLDLIEARGERDAAYADVDRLTARLAAMAENRLIALRFHPDDVPAHRYRRSVVHRNRRVPKNTICVCGRPCLTHHPVTGIACCRHCYDNARHRIPEVLERRRAQRRAYRQRQKEQQA